VVVIGGPPTDRGQLARPPITGRKSTGAIFNCLFAARPMREGPPPASRAKHNLMARFDVFSNPSGHAATPYVVDQGAHLSGQATRVVIPLGRLDRIAPVPLPPDVIPVFIIEGVHRKDFVVGAAATA